MRHLLLLFCVGVLSLNTYSQSKLQGAGKASRVGETTSTQKKPTTSVKPSQTKKIVTSSSQIRRSSNDGGKHTSGGYMEVLDISFANTDGANTIIDNYDGKLYAKEVKYLTPKISYNGLSSEEKLITLNIKVIDEDGNLKTGTSSPEGFTYSKDVKVEPGKNKHVVLSGWGNAKGGSYGAGLYKMEIWYKEKMLYEKEVRLYSGSTPIASNGILSINSISFANTDEDGNILNDYGQPLYDGQVQYLKPKIYYYGKYSSNQEVVLYVRYFKSSGDLVSGTSSPTGFSFKESVTIKPGANNVTLSGFGNKTATNYKEGTCKVEVWMDGEKLYETDVIINKPGTVGYSSGSSAAVFSDFFPIWGVTLGKTTWKQAKDMGYVVKIWENGPGRMMDVMNVAFWDHRGSGKFTDVHWLYYHSDFPASWKSKGFSWDNSYDNWIKIFSDLGCTIKVIKAPTTKKWKGRDTLSANFEALSTDGLLEFDLDFDFGENGPYTSSPKTLYSINIRYKGN